MNDSIKKYLSQMDEFVAVADKLDQFVVSVRNGTASSLAASAKRKGRRGQNDFVRAASTDE